jgi:RNA polymerase sigma-70 factor (ECF subfamily)
MKIDGFEQYLIDVASQVQHFLMKQGAKREEAEDIMQETFYKILKLRKVVPVDELRPWMFKVALNQYYDLKKTSKRRQEILEQSQAAGDLEVPDVELGAGEEETLLSVLDELQPDVRSILFMKYYQKLTYEDISIITELSIEGVKKKLYRARLAAQQLVKEMEENGE